MSSILVVEDDHRFRETVANCLVIRGFRVKTAANGPQAIELGSLHRPRTLVVDWNLNGRLNGLEVARALRLVCPELQVILMTGFLSHDLEDEASGLSAVRSIRKPFALGALYEAVRTAELNRLPSGGELELPVFEIDASSHILYRNREAERLVAESEQGTRCARFSELFLDPPRLDLGAAAQGWLDLVAAFALPTQLSLATRPFPGQDRWLVVVHRDGQDFVRRLPEVDALLGRDGHSRPRRIAPGHALIAEPNAFLRHALKARLHAEGAVCHTAGDRQEALDLLRRDRDIDVVILDFDLPGGRLTDLVAEMIEARPGIHIVGTGNDDRRREFRSLGVRRFVRKPLDWHTLIEAIPASWTPRGDRQPALHSERRSRP